MLFRSDDRKWIRTEDVILAAKDDHAALLWKSHLWGTSRDLKFIRVLSDLTKLNAHAGRPDQGKRFRTGKGFQPWYQFAFDLRPETYGDPKKIPGGLATVSIRELSPETTLVGLAGDTKPIKSLLDAERYSKKHPEGTPEIYLAASKDGFRRSPDASLFKGPLVLVTKGFGCATFFEEELLLFKDPLTGISGNAGDAELLMFLTAYIRSKLGFYFVFHTAGALGTEREEVQVEELLELPFPLPESDEAVPDSQNLVHRVATKMRSARASIKALYDDAEKHPLRWMGVSVVAQRKEIVKALQGDLEPLIYAYFGLTPDEIVLVEDTYDVYWPSATPENAEKDIVTLRETKGEHLCCFADLLCKTMNRWGRTRRSESTGPAFVFVAEYASISSIGLAMVVLSKSDHERLPVASTKNADLDRVLDRISRETRERRGAFDYLRGTVYATPDAIYLVKPALYGQWTRSAALNAADEIFEAIVSSAERRSVS